jgi:hypothetical protein
MIADCKTDKTQNFKLNSQNSKNKREEEEEEK